MKQSNRTKRRFVILLQAVLLVGLLAFYFLYAPYRAQHPVLTDLGKFYASASLLRDGQDIYTSLSWDAFGPLPDSMVSLQRDTVHPNLNLPHVTVLLAPIALFDFRTVFLFWSALSLVAGLAACVVLWQAVSPNPKQNIGNLVWIWIAFLGYFPTFCAFQLGQLTFILFLLVALAWRLGRSSANLWLAGVLLGLAASMKLFIGALVLFVFIRRQWQTVIGAAVMFTVMLLLGYAFVGMPGYTAYFDNMSAITWYGNNWNASFLSFFSRIFGGSENVPWINAPRFAHALATTCSLAAIAWASILAWPKRLAAADSVAHYDLAFGLMLAVMLLASPLGWMYYFPLLLLPGVAAWQLTASRISRRYRWGIVFVWICSSIPISMFQSRELNQPLSWVTWTAIYFYALLAAVAVLSLLILDLLRRKRGGPGQSV